MEPIELTLTHPAAGGGFVGRDESGRVIFVRHGLPGERVRAVITEEHQRWARADAIEILEESPDRVKPPCHLAGTGKCGGCDYQHASLEAQRRFKGQLIAEQLRRVAKIDLTVEVEPAHPETDGLGNRTRVRFGVTEDGRLAMRRHGSHDLVEVKRCPLAVEAISDLDLGRQEWPEGCEVEIVALEGSDEPSILITRNELSDDESETLGVVVDDSSARTEVTEVDGLSFNVSPGSFWQIHRRAPEILVTAVLEGLELSEGDQVLDLYCGAGLFTKAIAREVGESGLVVGLETSAISAADARRNTSETPWVDILTIEVGYEVIEEVGPGFSHVVLDPPRSGVDRGALESLCEITALRRMVSVSCDPATFARDLRFLLDEGWELESIRAFDLFEMTEHVEIVAVLERL
jgi:tRNA/tmRNA/rRNA uracil-C5-methylase (TrmA/RlmC/RlmD family)